MEKSLRNFLVAGLIMACVPAITAAQPAVQGPITKVQHQLNSQLIEAARTGNVQKIKQLAAQGADVNAKSEGMTALMHAVAGSLNRNSLKALKTCKALIAAGADVNAQVSESSGELSCNKEHGKKKRGKKVGALEMAAHFRKEAANFIKGLKSTQSSKQDLKSYKNALAVHKELLNELNKIYKFLYWNSWKAKVRNFFKRS